MPDIIDEERIKEGRFAGGKFDGTMLKLLILVFIVGMIAGIIISDSVKSLFKGLIDLPVAVEKKDSQIK